MMKSSRELEKIQSKIDALKNQQQKLIEQRQKEITYLISQSRLAELDNKTLMGGFLHISQTLTVNPHLKESWQQAGLTFLRKSKNNPIRRKLEKVA